MQTSKFVVGLCVAVVAMMALSTFGTIITPNDDAYITADANSTPHDEMGLYVRTDFPRRNTYIEFDIPAEAADALAASFVLYQTNPNMTYTNIAIRSEKDILIDETTLTWNNRPDTPIGPSTWPDQLAPNWQPADYTSGSVSFDVLSWFQAQAGYTVTIRLRNGNAKDDAHGPALFEDREGTLTGYPALGPHIDWTPIPEPSSLVFVLATGALLTMRRKR